MADRWAADMVEAVQKRAVSSVGADSGGLTIAKVNTASPLTIKINDQIISKHLYANPAYFSATETPLEAQFILHGGDEVVVFQCGDSFYLIAKAAAV